MLARAAERPDCDRPIALSCLKLHLTDLCWPIDRFYTKCQDTIFRSGPWGDKKTCEAFHRKSSSVSRAKTFGQDHTSPLLPHHINRTSIIDTENSHCAEDSNCGWELRLWATITKRTEDNRRLSEARHCQQ
ncbi:hypothetical protein N431DRAFT_53478 [Stipitochalara longipes BDJ]|nr:hypothetical protein N431DRAFT_53478 [Stipitochalara longipes BDJ]